MKEAIVKRVSRRTYKDVVIDKEKKGKIEKWIKEINEKSGLAIIYVEDGSKAFQSFSKTYGMFKNVRSIILLKGDKDDENLKEKVGYYGEELILNITDINLGTCWVGGTFDEKNVNKINDDEKLECVITVGVVENRKSFKEKLIGSLTHIKRKPINKRFESKETPPSWFMKGMKAVELAPSALNSQKAIFTYENGEAKSKIENNYRFDMIDLGIAKKHFEIEAEGKFDFGNGGKFHKNN